MRWRMTAPPAARPGAAQGWGVDAEAGTADRALAPTREPVARPTAVRTPRRKEIGTRWG